MTRRTPQFLETHRPRRAVEERDAVEQDGGGEQAREHIFEGTFRGLLAVPGETGQNVEAYGHEFQAEVDDQKVGTRNHDHHPHGSQQDKDGELSGGLRLFSPLLEGGEEHQDRCQQQDHLENHREPVTRPGTPEELRRRPQGPLEKEEGARRSEEGKVALAPSPAPGKDRFGQDEKNGRPQERELRTAGPEDFRHHGSPSLSRHHGATAVKSASVSTSPLSMISRKGRG